MKWNYAQLSAKISELNKFAPAKRSERKIKKALRWAIQWNILKITCIMWWLNGNNFQFSNFNRIIDV